MRHFRLVFLRQLPSGGGFSHSASRFYAIKWLSGFRDGNRNYSNSRFASLKRERARLIFPRETLCCESASSLSRDSRVIEIVRLEGGRGEGEKRADSWKEGIRDWLTISIKLSRLSPGPPAKMSRAITSRRVFRPAGAGSRPPAT